MNPSLTLRDRGVISRKQSYSAYGQENFEDNVISAPWNSTQFFPEGTLAPQVVTDPLAQQGKVLLLEADYTPSLATDYSETSKQQTAIHINPQYARAGMNTDGVPIYTGMETWYRFKVMAPSGNIFSCGGGNWITEWHDTTGGAGPKSSGIFAFGSYPLLPQGTSTTKFIYRETVDIGGGNYQDRYFPGDTADLSIAAQQAPNFTLDHWFDIVLHKIWHTSPGMGLAEWWLDGVQKASKVLQTQASNDYYSWGFYNYRYNVTGNSQLYYDDIVWGPNPSSIGFTL